MADHEANMLAIPDFDEDQLNVSDNEDDEDDEERKRRLRRLQGR
jgi:hypothetical protein